MEHVDELLRRVMRLWDEGKFMRTAKIDGLGVSLYKLDGLHHLIWYTKDNQILKYESIQESEIEPLFARATEDEKFDSDDNILKIVFQSIDLKRLASKLKWKLQTPSLTT